MQEAQRLWLKFRDANCSAERNMYGSGTAASMVYAACIEADTRQRTAELKTMYGWRWQKAGKRIRDSEINLEQKKWIEGVMLSSMTVKVGMTRSELLNVFTTEGGISTASQRIYVHRECPYIKVDVKFAAASPMQELPTDKIVEISRPYLDGSVTD